MTQKTRGMLALLLTVLLWGPAPVVTKLALLEIPPFSFAFFRFVVATAVMAVVFLPRGYFRVQNSDVKTFILAGLIGSVINTGLFYFGIQLTSAISAQTIFTSTPIFTAVLAYIILKERIRRIQVIGVLIGLLGGVTIAAKDVIESGSFDGGTLFGNSLIFLATMSWVGYILVSKNLSNRYSPITITSLSFLVGLIAFTPLAIIESLQDYSWVYSVGVDGLFGVFYQGIFASVLAFLAYQTGIKLTSAFAAGVITYLNPVTTTLVAVPVLGERITALFLLGAALIILGSFFATQTGAVRVNSRPSS